MTKILLVLLTVDINIPLWAFLLQGVIFVILGVWQIIKLYFSQKDTRETFKRVYKEIEQVKQSMTKEIDHVRTRNKIELSILKEEKDKEILELKVLFKENTHELRELRDAIMRMSGSVDLIALKDLRSHKDRKGSP